MNWVKYRFHANEDDYRPIKWPAKGPYWCSGYGDGYAIIIAYLPEGEPLTDWWPEASDVESEPKQYLQFSGRFPRPTWWTKRCSTCDGEGVGIWGQEDDFDSCPECGVAPK